MGWEFEAVPGFFSNPVAVAAKGPNCKYTTQPLFGLSPHQSKDSELDGDTPNGNSDATTNDQGSNLRDWPRFVSHVRSLNTETTRYKIIFLTRHGLGYHNQKAAETGPAWDEYWSHLNGDDETTWFDSFLNAQGITQIQELSALWRRSIEQGVPVPQKLYTSPLARCLQTTEHLFASLMRDHGLPFRPTVLEDLRERYTTHTCDLRRPRSWIEQNYPAYHVHDVPEEDRFAGQTTWETVEEHNVRKHGVLEHIFNHDEDVVSLTTHSLAIDAILRVCHHPKFKTRVGTSLALLIKGTRTPT